MALWVCNRCTTKFAAGLRSCPQCTSESAHEEGTEMPKTTKHGATNAAEDTAEEQQSETDESPAREQSSDYDSFTKDELQDMLTERGLSTSGNKPVLIERLEADDAEE